jgi:hypothetical protein
VRGKPIHRLADEQDSDADDQNDVLKALRILLKGEGHQTDAVTSLVG